MVDDEVSPELSEGELTQDQISMKAKKEILKRKKRICAEWEHKGNI
jgi:hypothetical protein